MCEVFDVSRSGYYDWLDRAPSARQVDNQEILKLIRNIHKESKGRYGSPKITEELKKRGIQISRPRVARIMKQANIRSIVHKKFRVRTTDSNHNYPVAKNLLDRGFMPSKIGEAWVSDITYIRTLEGWLYLTVIVDLGDRKVIGRSLSQTMKALDTIIPAWIMAIKNRPITAKLLFHSDRGVQYACHEFRDVVRKQPLVMQSMSRKGNCWDNAVAESFFKTLKSELINCREPKTMAATKVEVFDGVARRFIEIWRPPLRYNRKRIHSSLGYRTPAQMEQLLNQYTLVA